MSDAKNTPDEPLAVVVDTRTLTLSGDKYPLVQGDGWLGIIYQRDTAFRIARAVNCHANLLAACKSALPALETAAKELGGTGYFASKVDIVRDAIAKAEPADDTDEDDTDLYTPATGGEG